MRLTKEENRALAFIAMMIGLSILGRWADRPLPVTGDLAAVNIDSLATASRANPPRRGAAGKPKAKEPGSAPVAKRPTAPRSAALAPPALPADPVDLNRATTEELQGIKGIGPVLAGRIISYRDSVGRFANIDALLGVKGVGPAMLERLRPHVRVP